MRMSLPIRAKFEALGLKDVADELTKIEKMPISVSGGIITEQIKKLWHCTRWLRCANERPSSLLELMMSG